MSLFLSFNFQIKDVQQAHFAIDSRAHVVKFLPIL